VIVKLSYTVYRARRTCFQNRTKRSVDDNRICLHVHYIYGQLFPPGSCKCRFSTKESSKSSEPSETISISECYPPADFESRIVAGYWNRHGFLGSRPPSENRLKTIASKYVRTVHACGLPIVYCTQTRDSDPFHSRAISRRSRSSVFSAAPRRPRNYRNCLARLGPVITVETRVVQRSVRRYEKLDISCGSRPDRVSTCPVNNDHVRM